MRDGFECKKCNAKKNLQAHHCIPVNVSPEMVYDINNGITLCRSCHAEFHSKYGHSRCGHYEISEFIGNSETITIDSFCNANRTTHPIIKSTRAPPAYIKTAISIPVNLHNDVKEFASGKPFSTTLCHLVRLGLQFEKMIKDGES